MNLTKKLLISILCLGPAFLFQYTPVHAGPKGYEIRIKIEGLRDSLVHLANYYGDKQYLKDSTYCDAQGQVVFKGDSALPGGIYLFVFPNKTYFELLIDKEQHFSMECQMDNVVPSMRVKNSEDNRLFYEYLRFIQEQSKQVEPLRAQRKALAEQKENTDAIDAQIKVIDTRVADYKKKFSTDHPGTFLASIFQASEEPQTPELPKKADGSPDSAYLYYYVRDHFFDQFDLADERLLRTPIYHSKLNFYVKNMLIQIPDSLYGVCDMLVKKAEGNKETFKYMIWFLTNHYETANIMGLDAVFVHMVNNYYTKEKAYWVDDATLYKIRDRARILGPILIGKKAKNLILPDSTGTFQALHGINSPITILYFWDPDCGHCKKATPKVWAYYNKVKSKGVQVYAVCTEVEIEKWKKFIQEHTLDWINVCDPKLQNNFREDFDIKTTPQIFILDKDKKIIAKKIDEDNMEKIVDRELEMMGGKK